MKKLRDIDGMELSSQTGMSAGVSEDVVLTSQSADTLPVLESVRSYICDEVDGEFNMVMGVCNVVLLYSTAGTSFVMHRCSSRTIMWRRFPIRKLY